MPVNVARITATPQENFRTVKLASPTGMSTMAQAFSGVSNTLDTMNKVIETRIESNLKLQGQQAGLNADDMSGYNNDDGSRAAAYNEGFMSSYLAKLDMDTTANFEALSSKYANAPMGADGLEGAFDAHIQAVVAQTPPEAQPQIEIALRRKAVTYQSKANTAFMKTQKESQKSTLLASVEHNTQELERIGFPTTPEDTVIFHTKFETAKQNIDALEKSGLMTPGDASKQRLDLKERMELSASKQLLMNNPNPLILVGQIATKSTGDKNLDNMRPDHVTKLVAFAQQLDTAQNTVVNRKEKRDKKIREATLVSAARSVYQNPTGIKNPEMLESMKVVAQTSDELNHVMKLQKFITEASAERYEESEPTLLQSVSNKVRTLDIDQEELDNMHGNGLSTADYLSASDELDANRDGVMSSPVIKLFKDQLNLEFPVKKVSAMDMFMSSLSGNEIDKASFEVNSERNEQLVQEALIDVQQKVVDGELTSKSEIRLYTQTKLNELKQSYGGTSTKGLNVDTPKPEEERQKQREAVAKSKPGISEKAAMYPTKEDVFKALKSGELTRAEATMIHEANKEKYASEPKDKVAANTRS